jgi:hypothetical protein
MSCSTHEGDDKFKVLIGKSEGRRPLTTYRHRWEDTIKTDLKEIGWEGAEWIYLNQERDQ